MDTQTLILAILSSSLISATLTSGISIYLSHRGYKNDYYKEIIKRRLAAYQSIEVVIAALKTSTFDDGDARLYHAVFANGIDFFTRFHLVLNQAVEQSLWISNSTTELLVSMSYLFFDIHVGPDDDEELKEIGKEKYQAFADMRGKLEDAFRRDFTEIHLVHKFLNEKGDDAGYRWVNLRDGRRLDDPAG